MQNSIPPALPGTALSLPDRQDSAAGTVRVSVSTGAANAIAAPTTAFASMPPRPGMAQSGTALQRARVTTGIDADAMRHTTGFDDVLNQWYHSLDGSEVTVGALMDKNIAFHRIRTAYGQGASVLDLNSLQLKTLPDCLLVLASLRTLLVNNNQLQRLPALPAALEKLVADGNALVTLPPLPSTVQAIHVSKNQLTLLPELPAAMKSLRADTNYLARLPDLPAGLVELHAEDNELTTIPTLPAGLDQLHIGFNRLTALPLLPISLRFLGVSSNKLVELPSPLPANLETIDIDDNELRTLPALPGTVTALYAQDNHLTALPELPSGLMRLQVGQNQLRMLPGIPAGITCLDVDDNQLTVLPDLPLGLESLAADPGVVTESLACLRRQVAHCQAQGTLDSTRLPSQSVAVPDAGPAPGEQERASWLAKAGVQIAILQRFA